MFVISQSNLGFIYFFIDSKPADYESLSLPGLVYYIAKLTPSKYRMYVAGMQGNVVLAAVSLQALHDIYVWKNPATTRDAIDESLRG